MAFIRFQFHSAIYKPDGYQESSVERAKAVRVVKAGFLDAARSFGGERARAILEKV